MTKDNTAALRRQHLLEIRGRVRDCREQFLEHPDDDTIRREVDREMRAIQEDCLHLDAHSYTIEGVPGFSCGECGLQTGAREGCWDRVPISRARRITSRLRLLWWSVSEHCNTFSLAKRTYRIYHYYDYSTTPSAYVVGRGNPASILAYLQFRAERELTFDCQLENHGAGRLLIQFYGYKPSEPVHDCEDVDFYEVRELRCSRRWHNWMARLLYWRPCLSREIGSCVEE